METSDQRARLSPGGHTGSCGETSAALSDAARKIDVELNETATRLFALFCEQILEISARMNVTGLRTPDAIGHRLFLDSLTVLRAVDAHMDMHARIIDVGSGAGIPGIPLAIARPSWSFTLLESIEKKAAFLRQTVERLALNHVSVHACRAETFATGTEREGFDLAIARAVAALPTLVEYCAPLVREGGLLAFPKSGDVAGEIRSANRAAATMQMTLLDSYGVPEALGFGPGRWVVIYRKHGPTPSGYPRPIGLAKSQPIGGTQPTRARFHGSQPQRE